MTSGHFFPDKIALPEAIAALLEKCRGKRRALLPRRASWWNGLGNLEAACPMNGVGPGGTPPKGDATRTWPGSCIGIGNVLIAQRRPPHRTRRLATGVGIGGQRRDPVDGEPGAGRSEEHT